MRRTHKLFDLKPLICAILTVCSVLSVMLVVFTTHENKTLREQNKRLSERVVNLPDDFGAAGYIKAVGDDYIDVVKHLESYTDRELVELKGIGDKMKEMAMYEEFCRKNEEQIKIEDVEKIIKIINDYYMFRAGSDGNAVIRVEDLLEYIHYWFNREETNEYTGSETETT